MTITEFFLKAIGKVKPLRSLSQSLCRYMVYKPWLRRSLNSFYNKLSYQERIVFHYLFATIFRNRVVSSIDGAWKIRFNNKSIDIPLRSETLWLDWDLAISIVGHDVEIKSFYEKFINSSSAPLHFFDIGANYGTHSLLFLSQGIQTITFEPNPDCHPIFVRFLQANSLDGQLEKMAVGDEKAQAELVFPKNDTWNGSLQTSYQEELNDFQNLKRIKVEITTLDEFVALKNIKPDIIKIDTEGFELNVIRGAKRTILDAQPVIVFESNKSSERKALFKEFEGLGYQIFDIEKFFLKRSSMLEQEFVNSKQMNFVGLKVGSNFKGN